MADVDSLEVKVDWNGDGDFSDANEDITSDIQSINWQRGKEKQLGTIQAAILNLTTKAGTCSKYSTENTGGVLYGNILPYRLVRVRVQVAAAWYTQFYGYLKRVKAEPRVDKNYAYLYVVDGMEQTARAIGSMGNIGEPLTLNSIHVGNTYDVSVYSQDPTFSTAREAAVGDAVADTSTTITPACNLGSYPSYPSYRVRRGFLSFPTSSLAGKTIVTAKLRLYHGNPPGHEIEADSADLHCVEGVQNAPVVVADFGAHLNKTTSFGMIRYEDLPVSVEGYLVLNALGRAHINKTGTTKFCLRTSGDINNITPTSKNDVKVFTDFYTDNRRPQLEITYYDV